MKYALDFGHNCPPDTGAMGGLEDELVKELGNKVSVGLASLSHDIVIVNPKGRCVSVRDSLWTRCNNANKARADRYVSFHFNAFNGIAEGTEVFYTSTAGKRMAVPVVDEICKLSHGSHKFIKRGAKRTSHYYVLNNTNMPAILVETCFCDNSKDMETYKMIGVGRVASAIVKGLTGEFPKTNDAPCVCIE